MNGPQNILYLAVTAFYYLAGAGTGVGVVVVQAAPFNLNFNFDFNSTKHADADLLLQNGSLDFGSTELKSVLLNSLNEVRSSLKSAFEDLIIVTVSEENEDLLRQLESIHQEAEDEFRKAVYLITYYHSPYLHLEDRALFYKEGLNTVEMFVGLLVEKIEKMPGLEKTSEIFDQVQLITQMLQVDVHAAIQPSIQIIEPLLYTNQ